MQLITTFSFRLSSQAPSGKDPEVLSVDKLEVGQLIRGYVKSVGVQGVFMR